MKFLFFALITSVFAFSAHAEPLKFKSWKEQQIMEAQNEVLRVSIRLRQAKTMAKTDKTAPTDDYVTPSKFQKADEISEKDLKSAQDKLEFVKDLTIEDYAEIYVSELQQNPEQFSKLVDSLSKEELSKIMRILVKSKAEDTNDAKHDKAALPGHLAVSARRS